MPPIRYAVLIPELPGNLEGLDVVLSPPGAFIAMVMQLLAMRRPEWDDKLTAHLAP